uniref:Putative LAGLIDADG homing endonuclease n=1 Tax=Tydemania expeditionis TaxID=325645 RepID=A0A0D6E1K7_TYDEX|nr:putative LAGLIDADG homing endonuclease [Tydemania expeditionis]CEO91111.1 putative LAGLIDADG homing endonuclease [Tydemania expeditionis]
MPNLKNKQLAQISLSKSCKAIILGSLLGDGSLKLYKPYKNARFWIRHSWIQKEYWEWKIAQLDEIRTYRSHLIQFPSGFSQNKKLLFQSGALKELTQIYKLTYKQNILQIKRTWLNHMTPLSLAIWWLDDGSIIGHGQKGVFCTDSFSKKQLNILKRYLLIVWKIKVSIGQLNRIYKGQPRQIFRLYLNNTDLKQFFRIIMPLTPIPSMIYKYCILYKDTELQQRWISEMFIAFPDLKKEIIETIRQRKQQLTYFRK